VAWRLGRPKEAIRDLDAALKADPGLAVARYIRGQVRLASGDPAGAADKADAVALLPAIEQVVERCQEAAICSAATSLAQRNAIWCDGGPSIRVDQQITGCTSVIQTAANTAILARALVKRSRAHLILARREEALADADRAVALAAKSAAAHIALGYVHYYHTHYDAAIVSYDEAIKLSPSSPSAYFYRGLAKRAKGEIDGSIVDFDRAILLDPEYDAAFEHRGHSYARSGDYRRAIADFNKAILIDSANASALNGRGEAYAAIGNRTRALHDLKAAIRLNPVYGEDRD
jgi:tetratricopeptide (TPR) repeat protein